VRFALRKFLPLGHSSPHYNRLPLLFGGIVRDGARAENRDTITLEHTISERAENEVCPRAERSILIVEAPIVQKFLRAVLEREGYEAVEAEPQSALELVEVCQPPVGLIITNVPTIFLPLAGRLPLLYMAACPDMEMASRFRNCRVLRKPFHPGELVDAVKRLNESQ